MTFTRKRRKEEASKESYFLKEHKAWLKTGSVEEYLSEDTEGGRPEQAADHGSLNISSDFGSLILAKGLGKKFHKIQQGLSCSMSAAYCTAAFNVHGSARGRLCCCRLDLLRDVAWL
jgi:hypothetical protein